MTIEIKSTRLTEEQIRKVIEQYNKQHTCIEAIEPMIAQAEAIAAIVTKLAQKTDEVWDIMRLTGTYKYTRNAVRVKPNQQQAFDYIVYVEEMLQEWEKIKDDEEVLMLLKEEN